MIYTKTNNKIIIHDKTQFNLVHIFECGQVFSYIKVSDQHFIVYSSKYKAELIENDNNIAILTDNIEYFINYFDLDNDYNVIKSKLSKFDMLKEPLSFGSGIRILKQDLLEIFISFAISANNNIKRIQKSVFYIREHLGENENDYFCFPTLEKLKTVDEQFFIQAGTGYRAKQLVKLINQLSQINLIETINWDEFQLKKWLISLSGVGEKVANCILLFGYGAVNAFPVDTWIRKAYCKYFGYESDVIKMSKMLKNYFGELSGYAQQYIFYYNRSKK